MADRVAADPAKVVVRVRADPVAGVARRHGRVAEAPAGTPAAGRPGTDATAAGGLLVTGARRVDDRPERVVATTGAVVLPGAGERRAVPDARPGAVPVARAAETSTTASAAVGAG